MQVGTDTEKDLAAAQPELIQSQIQDRKDVHKTLTAAEKDTDIIVAEVQESWGGQVVIGQGCKARFLSLSEQKFTGKVHAIVPVLSAERRSLCVLLSINDPEDGLRPGTFAEIGIGTAPRTALFAPSESIIHIGRGDYVLVQEEDSVWRVTEVKVGELRNGSVEILDGLQDGASAAGRGAILLKQGAATISTKQRAGDGAGTPAQSPDEGIV